MLLLFKYSLSCLLLVLVYSKRKDKHGGKHKRDIADLRDDPLLTSIFKSDIQEKRDDRSVSPKDEKQDAKDDKMKNELLKTLLSSVKDRRDIDNSQFMKDLNSSLPIPSNLFASLSDSPIIGSQIPLSTTAKMLGYDTKVPTDTAAVIPQLFQANFMPLDSMEMAGPSYTGETVDSVENAQKAMEFKKTLIPDVPYLINVPAVSPSMYSTEVIKKDDIPEEMPGSEGALEEPLFKPDDGVKISEAVAVPGSLSTPLSTALSAAMSTPLSALPLFGETSPNQKSSVEAAPQVQNLDGAFTRPIITGTETGLCSDQYDSCADFAKNEYCTKYPELMKIQCRKSCGYCVPGQKDVIEKVDPKDKAKMDAIEQRTLGNSTDTPAANVTTKKEEESSKNETEGTRRSLGPLPQIIFPIPDSDEPTKTESVKKSEDVSKKSKDTSKKLSNGSKKSADTTKTHSSGLASKSKVESKTGPNKKKDERKEDDAEQKSKVTDMESGSTNEGDSNEAESGDLGSGDMGSGSGSGSGEEEPAMIKSVVPENIKKSALTATATKAAVTKTKEKSKVEKPKEEKPKEEKSTIHDNKKKVLDTVKTTKSNLGEFTLPVYKSEVSTAALALNDKSESDESGSGSGSGDDTEAEEQTIQDSSSKSIVSKTTKVEKNKGKTDSEKDDSSSSSSSPSSSKSIVSKTSKVEKNKGKTDSQENDSSSSSSSSSKSIVSKTSKVEKSKGKTDSEENAKREDVDTTTTKTKATVKKARESKHAKSKISEPKKSAGKATKRSKRPEKPSKKSKISTKGKHGISKKSSVPHLAKKTMPYPKIDLRLIASALAHYEEAALELAGEYPKQPENQVKASEVSRSQIPKPASEPSTATATPSEAAPLETTSRSFIPHPPINLPMASLPVPLISNPYPVPETKKELIIDPLDKYRQNLQIAKLLTDDRNGRSTIPKYLRLTKDVHKSEEEEERDEKAKADSLTSIQKRFNILGVEPTLIDYYAETGKINPFAAKHKKKERSVKKSAINGNSDPYEYLRNMPAGASMLPIDDPKARSQVPSDHSYPVFLMKVSPGEKKYIDEAPMRRGEVRHLNAEGVEIDEKSEGVGLPRDVITELKNKRPKDIEPALKRAQLPAGVQVVPPVPGSVAQNPFALPGVSMLQNPFYPNTAQGAMAMMSAAVNLQNSLLKAQGSIPQARTAVPKAAPKKANVPKPKQPPTSELTDATAKAMEKSAISIGMQYAKSQMQKLSPRTKTPVPNANRFIQQQAGALNARLQAAQRNKIAALRQIKSVIKPVPNMAAYMAPQLNPAFALETPANEVNSLKHKMVSAFFPMKKDGFEGSGEPG